MSSYNLPSVTQSLFRDHHHDYLHYCGILLARLLITDVLNTISSLPRVFSLCARVGWCDVCTEFTNLIKVDVDIDVNEMSLSKINKRNFRETIYSVARGPYVSSFLTDRWSLCWQKCGPGPKLFPRLDIFSTFRAVHTLIFTYCMCLTCVIIKPN